MERVFAKREYMYGSGVVDTINRRGFNNNPYQADPDERYLSIFEGYIYIPKDGVYAFAVNGDDAVELIIDKNYFGWYGGHGADGVSHNRLFRLRKGYHKIKFRHQEWSGSDNYQLYWRRPGERRYTIVPKSNLFHCAPPVPIAEYRMDACRWRGIEGEVKDSQGVHNATAMQGVQTVAGKLCKAAGFDGIDDFIKVPNSKSFDNTSKLTIMAWIYPTKFKNPIQNARGVISKRVDFKKEYAYGLFFWNEHGMKDTDGDGEPDSAKLYVDIDGTNDRFSSRSFIKKERWTHIAVVYDGSKPRRRRVKLYINGELDTIAYERSRKIPHYNSDLYIGDLFANGKHKLFAGKIDEVKIFNKALKNREIQQIYNYENEGKNWDGVERDCIGCKPVCTLHEGLLLSTYDIRKYTRHYPQNHHDYDILETLFAKREYMYGSGVVDTINRRGFNNNPYQADPDERYLSIFEGYIYIPKDGVYAFAVNGDDAVELIIDKNYFGWYGGHGADGVSHNRLFRLRKGYHKIKFRHQEWSGSDNYQLYWRRPGERRYTIVPKSNLFHCQKYQEKPIYKFDVLDIERSLSDHNISTKVVNKKFDLTIVSLDKNGTKVQDFNGTVCVQIVQNKDNEHNLTGWKQLEFVNQSSIKWRDIKVVSAAKDARVKIVWKEDVNESCPLKNEENETLSSDNFAIRPSRFWLQVPITAYAKDVFTINAKALDHNSTPAKDYNETVGVSIKIEAKETKLGCKEGYLRIRQGDFQNGILNNFDANYSEIGDINITLQEINGSEFASVDRDDTNDSLRFITPASALVQVRPYTIKIEAINVTTATGEDWLYIIKDSNLSEMNITVGAKVQVLDKENRLLEDFNASCYGKDLHVKFFYDVDKTANTQPVNVVYVGTTTDTYHSLNECNKSIFFAKNIFQNGEGFQSYAFDINSTFYKPLSPITLQLRKAEIVEDTIAKQKIHKNSDINITFYYGQMQTKDLYTSKIEDNTTARILVFDKAGSIYTQGWREFIINWYLMQKDNISKMRVARITKEFDYTSAPINDIQVTTTNIHKGKSDIHIKNSSEYPNAFLHVNIGSWLWYSPSKKATFSKFQSCAHHPCIHYRYLKDESKGVKSGSVSGVKFEQNVSKERKGTKVFR